MIIETANIQDLPKYYNLVTAYNPNIVQDFDPKAFNDFWAIVINGKLGIIFIAFEEGKPIGAIGGLKCPSPYNGKLIAQEFFWCALPKEKVGCGRALLKAFENWAREEKCAYAVVSALANDYSVKLEKYYNRLGYVPLETNYIKEL